MKKYTTSQHNILLKYYTNYFLAFRCGQDNAISFAYIPDNYNKEELIAWALGFSNLDFTPNNLN